MLGRVREHGAADARLVLVPGPAPQYRLEAEIPRRDLTVVIEASDLPTIEHRFVLALEGRLWIGSDEELTDAAIGAGFVVATMRDSSADVRMMLDALNRDAGRLRRALRHVAMCCMLGIADASEAHPVQIARDLTANLCAHKGRSTSTPADRWESASLALALVTASLTGDERRTKAIGRLLTASTEPLHGWVLLCTCLVEEVGFAQEVSAWVAGEWVVLQFPMNELA